MTYYLIKVGEEFDVIGAQGFRPKEAIARVPAMFDKKDYEYLKGQLVEDETTGEMVWSVYIDEDKKGKKLAKKSKDDQKEAAESSYKADMAQEIVTAIGVEDRNDAIWLYLTWTMMVNQPEFYADKGLKDDKDKPLDTATKVSDYANGKLTRALDYSVYMIARKQQLKDELELIG